MHTRSNISFVQALNISYSEAMTFARNPFLFLAPATLMLPLMLTTHALAEDNAPPLPPPSEVADSPAARETVNTPPPEKGGTLSDELSVPEANSNVQIYSSTREDGTKIEEYSRNGHVYMVKISPPHGLPPYYLYDNNGDGTFERRIMGNYKHPSPPEWVIQRF